MTRGSDSISSSTRTFQSSPSIEPDKKPKKADKPAASRPRLKLNGSRLLSLLLALFAVFMIIQYHDAKQKLDGNQAANVSHQTASIVSRVQKLILLPHNETPTIVTVKDASKLQSEAFYADAQNGDVTLVYSKAKKAILYRPSQNIIVNVANVTVSTTPQQ